MVQPWGAGQSERQELYIRLAEWVWNPSRLDLDGEKPSAPEPIADPEDETPDAVDRQDRHEAQKVFWTELLAQANERSDLHSGISATRDNWVGARRHGHSWTYTVLQDATRAELYVDSPVAADNKALFDTLYGHRTAIEADFGGSPLLAAS